MVETLAELFLNTIKNYAKPDLMLYKKHGQWIPLSTEEFGQKVKKLSLGLWELGLRPEDKLIILSENRPEWVMTDLATISLGAITVPIYTTLMPEQIRYIIDDSDAKIVVYSDQEQGKKIEAIRSQLKKVDHYITFQEEAPPGVLTWTEVLAKGERVLNSQPNLFEERIAQIRPENVASIIYTSGTTGIPKGVMLMHSNFISNIKSCSSIIPFSSEDTVLSFLPLSHVLERMVMFTYLYKACTIAFAESIEAVAQNLLEIRPHIMVSVPRVFEKIYARVMENVLSESSLKRKIFFWALKVGKDYARRQLNRRPISQYLKLKRSIAHKLVFSKIIARTGGRVRFFVSGGAPLSKDIAEFFFAMGLTILEGYGLTETSPVISVNTFENLRLGTVGKPIPGVEVRIASDGEILTRGPHVMKGYYKKEAETKESFEGDWFKTGDIGYLDEDGFLVITDRKKDIIVTAGGKNVAPQPIENLLKTSPFISNAVVIGDRRRFISALIVPNFEKVEEWARQNNLVFASRSEMVKHPEVIKFLQAEVDRLTVNLASFEKVKKIAVLERDFDLAEGEITPTLKVRRSIIEKKYQPVIEALYREAELNQL
ncbi:MAG: long-chain fatty acid--CoA ligase [Candidatus Aminicenantes bacterium]|nr:long-chain fatty acid--CoA ligase [Candidatus Aminicenantes bacterium]